MTIISLNVDDSYGRRKTVCLVTWETLYLVWSLGRRLIWFRHSGDALSDLTHSGGVRGCVMIIVETLSGFNYSGDVV